MGFQDRQYYQDENDSFSFSGQTQSLCTTLVIINVVIFLVDWVLQLNLGQMSKDGAGGWFAVHSDTLLKPWLWFQFLTYGFMHATSGGHAGWHLFGNMFVLWMFGRFVEGQYGRAEFLRVYLISILLGGVAWGVMAVAGGSTNTHLIGASGAVTTILALFILNNPKATIYLGFLIPVPAWVLGVVIVVLEVLGAMQAGGNVAHSVHLVGGVFGVAYFYFRWNFGHFLPDKISLPKFKRKPKLKIHNPQPSDPYGESDEEAEHLLDKVRDQGIDSLTPAEHRKLEAYSRRMRQKLS